MQPQNQVVQHAHLLISEAEQAILQAKNNPEQLQIIKQQLEEIDKSLSKEAIHAPNVALPIIQQAQQQVAQVLKLVLTRQQQGEILH